MISLERISLQEFSAIMKVVQSVRHILNLHLIAKERKRNFKLLERMTDRELNDIGLPRECLYASSANQRRHTVAADSSNAVTDPRQHAA